MDNEDIMSRFKDKKEDPGFLVARGRFSEDSKESISNEKEHRSKLSNAIFMSIMNHGYANIRAVGTRAIANAVRSITIATERCKKRDICLYWDSEIDKGNLGPLRDPSHVQDVTAYVFKLQHFKDSHKPQD